jgi:hypothetical protein
MSMTLCGSPNSFSNGSLLTSLSSAAKATAIKQNKEIGTKAFNCLDKSIYIFLLPQT